MLQHNPMRSPTTSHYAWNQSFGNGTWSLRHRPLQLLVIPALKRHTEETCFKLPGFPWFPGVDCCTIQLYHADDLASGRVNQLRSGDRNKIKTISICHHRLRHAFFGHLRKLLSSLFSDVSNYTF